MGIVDSVKSIGSAIGGLFGFGGDDRTPEQKLNDTIRELNSTIKELNKNLGASYRDFLRSVSSPATQIRMAQSDFSSLSGQRGDLFGQIAAAGRAGDTEKVKELLPKLAEVQQQMIAKLQEGYTLQLSQLEDIQKKQTEKYQKERDAIMKTIDTLKGLKQTAVDAIAGAREQILGAMAGPSGNVTRLQEAFMNAATPEAKSAAASALAGGLQSKFQSYQGLAAQGAITGEEFARIQQEILGQLDQTEMSTVNYFDQLISVNQNQIKVLDAGFKKIDKAIEAEKRELKEAMLAIAKQLSKVPNFNGNALTSQIVTAFNNAFKTNSGNLRGNIRNG